MTTVSIDGGERMKAALNAIAEKLGRGGEVRVGFLEGATANGESAAFLGAVHEFGAPSVGIPPRPFLRPMVAAHEAEWPRNLAAALKFTGFNADAALALMGQRMQGQAQESMRAVTAPALSPVTLLLRERFWGNPQEITFKDVQRARADIASGRVAKVSGTQAKPLIWTGELLRAIDYEVKE